MADNGSDALRQLGRGLARLLGKPYRDELSHLPRHAGFPAIWVARQELPENPAEPSAAAAIVPRSRPQDVVDEELPNFLLTLSTAKQLIAQLKSNHRGDVLVSGNGLNFTIGQSSQAKAIFEGEHGGRPLSHQSKSPLPVGTSQMPASEGRLCAVPAWEARLLAPEPAGIEHALVFVPKHSTHLGNLG